MGAWRKAVKPTFLKRVWHSQLKANFKMPEKQRGDNVGNNWRVLLVVGTIVLMLGAITMAFQAVNNVPVGTYSKISNANPMQFAGQAPAGHAKASKTIGFVTLVVEG